MKLKSEVNYRFVFISCVVLSLVGYIANIYFPEYFIFSGEKWHIERSRIVGFQFKPNDLAILLSFAFIFVLLSSVDKSKKTIIGILLLSFTYFTSSRTALIIAVLALLVYVISLKKIRNPFLVIPAIPLALILGGSNISSTFLWQETISNISQIGSIDQTQYIRAIMIYYGAHLSLTFPTGVGAGNFGTVMSSGSPAYEMLGLGSSYFFRNMVGIYDSNLAAILGEYGFLGVGLYVALTKKILSLTVEDKTKSLVLIVIFAMMPITQPVFAYHVNSVNVLLLIFALSPPFKDNFKPIIRRA